MHFSLSIIHLIPCRFLLSFLYYTWNATTLPSSPPGSFGFVYSNPFPFSCPILGGIWDGPCWVPPVWVPFCSLLLEDLCFFLPPGFEMLCFQITIAVSPAARNIFSPLHRSPTCRSKAAWNRGSPLLEVRRSWVLTLHRRYVCSLSALATFSFFDVYSFRTAVFC